MVRQTINLGLLSEVFMERQAKSGKKICLGFQDTETKKHIKPKLFIGFLQNLHQQTRRIFVHIFVYEVVVL